MDDEDDALELPDALEGLLDEALDVLPDDPSVDAPDEPEESEVDEVVGAPSFAPFVSVPAAGVDDPLAGARESVL